MQRIGTNAGLAALMLVAGLVACGDDDNGGGNIGPNGEGKLTIILKDAPGDVQAAVVTIDGITLVTADGRRETVLSDPATLDLFPLATRDTVLASEVTVKAGEYTRMQLRVSGAYVQVENDSLTGGSSVFATASDYPELPGGTAVTGTLGLAEPSDSNGFDVPMPGGGIRISNGSNDTLVVDFDVNQSFSGDSAGWTLTPILTSNNPGELGSASVTLRADSATQARFDSAGVGLGLFNGSFTGSDSVARTVAFAGPDSSGAFTANLRYLPAGSYGFNITGPGNVSAFTTDSLLPGTINVSGGGTATTAYTINSATFAP